MSRGRRNRRQVGPRYSLHVALWLVGLGILLWIGDLWPGILILAALSLILEALLLRFVPEAYGAVQPAMPASPSSSPVPPPPAAAHRLELLPAVCHKCGGPIRGDEVKWTGPQSADCIYCGANLPMERT
jgi:hypothetical protein